MPTGSTRCSSPWRAPASRYAPLDGSGADTVRFAIQLPTSGLARRHRLRCASSPWTTLGERRRLGPAAPNRASAAAPAGRAGLPESGRSRLSSPPRRRRPPRRQRTGQDQPSRGNRTTPCCFGRSAEPPTRMSRSSAASASMSRCTWRVGRRGRSPSRTAAPGKRKRIAIDGEDLARIADAAGAWLAVAFLPADVDLAAGPAANRRQYLDRMLSLADRSYLRALVRYRAALAQRNSALRQGDADLAGAFDAPLAAAGAEVVRGAGAVGRRRRRRHSPPSSRRLGERAQATPPLSGPCRLWPMPAGWAGALEAALPRDRARGMTTIGPHRDDLVIEIGGRPLRGSGSTGQQRSAAVALKLVELVSLRSARGTEPALLLDDVFAELDRDRQRGWLGARPRPRRAPGFRYRAAARRAAAGGRHAGVDHRSRTSEQVTSKKRAQSHSLRRWRATSGSRGSRSGCSRPVSSRSGPTLVGRRSRRSPRPSR